MNRVPLETSTKDLPQLLDRLFSRINFERREPPAPNAMRTESITQLVEHLGNPHLDYPIVHVAGTKGKGTVTKLVANLLSTSDRRVGAYTSPHLSDFRERFTINGSFVRDDLLTEALRKIFHIVDEPQNQIWAARLTFFDIATAVAFLVYSLEKVDAAVFEVGLGGRLDSTNICSPEVCVITNISFDHTRQLGNSLAEIAYAKAGIIKPSVPVVSGVKVAEARKVIERETRLQQTRLLTLGEDFVAENVRLGSGETTFDARLRFPTPPVCHAELELKLLGRHQVDNALLALAAQQLFVERLPHFSASPNHIHHALRQLHHPGRIQIVHRRPTIILDVAHNEASFDALLDTLHSQLDDWKQAESRTLVLAISKDKDQFAILRKCLPHFSRVILTSFVLNPRATPPLELLQMAESVQAELGTAARLTAIDDPQDAWRMVKQNLGSNDFCCVAGSLFLIGELQSVIQNDLRTDESPCKI
ncbi:MAG: bifunctional folylpolyglutamate synthase/dihydrofolate synthase [Pirellulaceae bacterium]|nr:bifunctional folylpolyglutamate synthase/dihydrofolate synthase [Pirellulaceae bacterium]